MRLLLYIDKINLETYKLFLDQIIKYRRERKRIRKQKTAIQSEFVVG